MIIQCEECKTKFNLDESLLKDEGSKVRCTVCRHIFVVYPPKTEPGAGEGQEVTAIDGEEFEETIAIDTSAPEEPVFEAEEEEKELFDRELETVLEEEGLVEDLPSLEDEEEEEKEDEELQPEAIEEEVEEQEEGREIGVEKPRRSKAGIIILLILLLIIGGSAAVIKFAPQYIPKPLLKYLSPQKSGESSDMGVRRLEFSGVSGSFVESKASGQLFVVKGFVVNNYPKPRSFIRIKARVLDEKGNVVKEKLGYAGTTFSEEELKTLPLEKINQALKNKRGKNDANVSVPPGGSVPFMIVFGNLPPDVSEFSVEAVSSSPAV